MRGVRFLNIFASAILAISAILVIGYLNYLLIANWFSGEFNPNIASIEISYVQMAKFWVESGGASWQPLWYLGYPWHVFYTPLLPALEVLLNSVLGFSFAHAYRVITGFFYVLVPISTFLFVWQVSRSKSGAFIAALIYSFVPSLIAFLFNEVRQDTISGFLEPRRFTIMVHWGEGPHTVALAFVPLFGVFLARFLDNSSGSGYKLRDLVAASIFLGLVALTNAIAFWAAVVLIVAFFLGKMAEGVGFDFIVVLKKTLLIITCTFGLIAFWYNLPFLGTFFKEGSGALSNWAAMFPWGTLVFGLVAGAIFMAVKKLCGSLVGVPFAVFWFLMMFSIVYVYYASGDSKLEYVPQALRLNTEADLAFAVLVGVLISKIFVFFINLEGLRKVIGFLIAAIVLIVPLIPLAIWANQLLSRLPEVTLPREFSSEITKTAEARVALRLSELTRGTNQRVFAPGNYGFWLNFFEPVAQIRGALYQSATHFWPEHIYYQVTNGADPGISLAWLKIANIGKLVYTTIGSAETYKDYKVPQSKFDKILKINKTEAGDVFYDVPLKNDLLAKLVNAGEVSSLKKPYNAIDEAPIYAYVDWIEKQSDRKLKVAQIKRDRFHITGEVREGEAVLFQATYDAGWSVRGSLGKWKVKRDPLDFILLIPSKTGEFELDLVYNKPLGVYFGYLVTIATILMIIIKGFLPLKILKKAN